MDLQYKSIRNVFKRKKKHTAGNELPYSIYVMHTHTHIYIILLWRRLFVLRVARATIKECKGKCTGWSSISGKVREVTWEA